MGLAGWPCTLPLRRGGERWGALDAGFANSFQRMVHVCECVRVSGLH